MKDVREVRACVVDYGSFIEVANTLAETMGEVSIYTPFEEEFLSFAPCVKADGMPKVTRVDDPMDPDFIKDIDLFVFPDQGYGGWQRYLESIGKAVWGSRKASDLELYRTHFLNVIKSAGLPMINSVRIKGLTKLANHLEHVKDKWIKINCYRGNMETWHHIDYQHSERDLERLNSEFGPFKEEPVFVVQDPIDSDVEVGYDGWCVDGEFPESSFQGYEKKNELYLGSRLEYKDLPEAVRYVNEAMAPVLKEQGYRNFWATEIRVKDDVPYFIDPTARMPGQTGEQLLETCSNLADVIWQGANGNLIKPDFAADFAAEATMIYTAGSCDAWKTIKIPSKLRRWVKLYHYCEHDDAYHFPPHKHNELGVCLGIGDTIEDALDHLKENADGLSGEPIKMQIEGFADLLREIKEAEKEGIEFSESEVPEPASVIED